jgi:prolyl-tRNA editing enzyme YbaK/EbsC (Cys-tRNA(Pro) deacylase)
MCGAELTSLPESVQRVARVLQDKGHPHSPVMLDDAARTAQQAADALGIAVGQIAKSIIFRRKSDDAAVLVITSGDRRVDEKKVAALVGQGQALGRADAEFVRAKTGYAIGGVPPLAHTTPPVTLIDRDLLRFDEVWAAAGHPHGVFRLHPQRPGCVLTGSARCRCGAGGRMTQPYSAPSCSRGWRAQVRQDALDGEVGVPSPCVSVCRMDPHTAAVPGLPAHAGRDRGLEPHGRRGQARCVGT